LKTIDSPPLILPGQEKLPLEETPRKFSVYLAGSSKDTTRVRLIAGRLAEAGIAITHRWFDLPKLGHDAALSDDEQREVSDQCRAGIYQADAFWLLMPGHGLPPSSSAIELGRALARRDLAVVHARGVAYPVIVTGGACRSIALTVDADLRSTFDNDGLLYLASLARAVSP